MTSKAAIVQDELLSAVDAAKILGLSADMVRILAREGRLLPAAQTVRGLRLFRRVDVEDLAAERAGRPAHRHAVQFYENDESIGSVLATMMGDALRHGAPVVIVATEPRRLDFCARLESQGVNVGAARTSAQLALHDAHEVLATFMVDGSPDRDRFGAEVGRIIERAKSARPRARLRVYGEMVDVLWKEGNPEAAIRLEELWNELGHLHNFSLLCAYDMQNFRDASHAEAFARVCHNHTHVIPAESYSRDSSLEDSMRQVAVLQQQAAALARELDERRQFEGRLRQALAERERAEEAVRKSREELRRQHERLVEATRVKDELLGLVGHELRNPLAPIRTALEVMRLRGMDTREQTILERQVAHLVQLLDDLLDISRLSRGVLELSQERVELADVVDRALESTSSLLQQRAHVVDVQVPEGLAALVDPARMVQVVANLISSAARCSAHGSAIRIRAERAGEVVRLAVKDEGPGIAAGADTSHPSERVAGGLGMAIVRNLVQLHGGNVSVLSEGSGRGSEVAIDLPAADGAPAAQASAPAAADCRKQPIQKPCRILVVDDNADLAALIGELLEHLGHTVELAYDGPSALEAAARFAPDVALLDIGLPIMDGYELAAALRVATGGRIHLVAISGYGQDADRRRSEEAGFSGHLVKPVSPELLARAVQDCGRPGADA
jgi:signal transduction histidine kinase/CheY-like chemotaxis protein